jgi:HK97 family phage major capsid protein
MKPENIFALRQRGVELSAQAKALLDVAQAAGRDLNAGELAQFNDLRLCLSKNDVAITECENQLDVERNSAGGVEVTHGGLDAPGFAGGAKSSGAKPGRSTYRELFGLQALSREGFQSADEFFSAVSRAQTIADPRLLRSAGIQAAGAQRESSPTQGGFLVPSEWAAQVLDQSLENEIVRPRAFVWPMNSNTRKIPAIDGFSHVGGVLYGGITAAWQNEMDTLTLQNLKLRLMELHTAKLALLVNGSNELLEDTADSGVDFGMMLDVKLRLAASWFLDQAFLFGSGTGQPRGVLNDPALIIVPIETGQTLANGPVLYANICKMFARLHPACRNAKTACWVFNSDLIPNLLQMQLVVKNVAGTENVGGSATPVFSKRPDGTFELLTLPVYFSEKASAAGTVGDALLADFSQFAIGIRKEIEIQRSMHAGFTTDSTWFRLVTRLAGQGTWKSPITPENGQPLSWAVTLAQRS